MSLRQPIAALELQPSETATLHAASRILAAWITSGRCPPGEEAQWLRRAVRIAIDLALEVDRAVESDDESGGQRRPPGPLG